MSSVGLSQVNFEGINDDEEQELEKEEEERERELHELLSKELPEDLLDDDDNLSFLSQGLSSSTHGHTTPEFDDQAFEQHVAEDADVPQGSGGAVYYEHTHPLLTRRGEEFIQSSEFSRGSDQPDSVPRGYTFRGDGYRYSDEKANHGGEGNGAEFHEEDNGYNNNYQLDNNHGNHNQYYPASPHDSNDYQPGSHDDNQPESYHARFGHVGGTLNDGDYAVSDHDGDFNTYYTGGQQNGGGIVGRGTNTEPDESEPRFGYKPIYDKNFNEIYSTHQDIAHQRAYDNDNSRDMNDNYTVQYTRNGSADADVIDRAGTESQNVAAPPNSELAQLRVLHQARGRKLEELTKELAGKEKEYERQIRLLNHHLALMKGERDGMSSSLKHVQELATERKNDCDNLEKRLHEAKMEKEQTDAEKDETQSELEAAKKTIESLHQQLMELEKSESLSRAREQHENIVMATRKRYEEDVVRLKQKLDEMNNSLVWKNEESKRLQEELMEARKEADRVRLDRAETVNRLTKSLEQSQKQNEELLKAGSTQEISHLQSQLQRTQRENENLREHYKTMEGDVVGLKEQLRIHENLSKLGLSMKNETVSPPATEAIKRNLAADDWKTPQPNSSSGNLATEEPLTGLQQQLQHALSTNRSKREEVEKLRVQLEVVQNDLVGHKNAKERMEMIMKKQEMKVLEQEKKISDLEELTKNPQNREEFYESELKKMKSMVEEYDFKLEQYKNRENEREKLNLQLKSQMSEMVREHDADKQKSIEQCRQSCLEFHDQAMSTMKEQLNAEHEQQLSKLRHDIEATSLKLDQAKESYVALSEETRWIEKQTRERCDEEMKRKIEELRIEWDEAKCHEIESLRQTVVTELEKNFAKEKTSWQKREDEIMKDKLQAEIAMAKMDWAKEKERDIQDAVACAEKEWILKYGQSEDWDEKIRNIKQTFELQKENEMKVKIAEVGRELDDKLSAAREEWEQLKIANIEQEVAKARVQWDENVEKMIAEAAVSSVTVAKADWTREQEAILHKAVDEAKFEALAEARKEWEQEKKNIDICAESTLEKERKKWRAAADEERSRALETALLVAEQKWRSEHEDKISEAVKEALGTVKESWRKERDTAIESAVSQSLHSAKEAWNESKVREIEQVLSAARKQWFTKFDILNINSAGASDECSSQETQQTFSYLEAQYSKNMKEFRETELKKALEEHERNKSQALKEQEEKHQTQLQTISQISQEDWDKELKDLETTYQNKLQAIVNEMEEKWNEKTAALEKDWNEKYEREHRELEESYCAKFEKEREILGRELREKYEKGIEHARKKLEHQFKERLQSAVESAKHEWEEEQEEDRLALEEQHLKKLASEEERIRQEMEQKNEIKLSEERKESRRLQEQLEEQKENYKNDIVNLQRELKEITRQRDNRNVKDVKTVEKRCQLCQTDIMNDQKWVSMSELDDRDLNNSSKLQQLRTQYLTTTAQLKDDFLHHVIQTRENAAKTIRTEVMKERHATAKRLRNYYLECLRELLENDKEAAKKNQKPRSDSEKMRIMEERLTEERQSIINSSSKDSTLTNVTALADSASEQRRQSEHHRQPEQTSVDPVSVDRDALRETRNVSRKPTRTSTVTRLRAKSEKNDRREYSAPVDTKVHADGAHDLREHHPGGRLVASSSESLLSLDTDVELSLPPAITFRQQEIPTYLLRPADASESDSSGSSEKPATAKHNVRSRDRPRGQNRGDRTNGEWRTNVGPKERTHKDRTKSEPYLDRPTVKFSAPVVSIKSKTEQPTKLTSSLPKPINDVLPSKTLSPINRAPPKFSYTMHSGSSSRKPNIG